MADLEAINRIYYNLLLESDESEEYIVSEIETEDFYKLKFLNAKSNFDILENQRRNKVENAKVYFQEILIEKRPTFEIANIEKRPTFEMANIEKRPTMEMANIKNSSTLETAIFIDYTEITAEGYTVTAENFDEKKSWFK